MYEHHRNHPTYPRPPPSIHYGGDVSRHLLLHQVYVWLFSCQLYYILHSDDSRRTHRRNHQCLCAHAKVNPTNTTMITLKTLPNATKQEVFNQVAHHLLTQGRQSVGSYKNEDIELTTGCAYRGTNSDKCAAGCLMSDEEYQVSWEGKSWSTLVEKEIAPDTHQRLISKLQIIHDTEVPQTWQRRLDELAESQGLIPYYLPKES